jgi:hypothetical protein
LFSESSAANTGVCNLVKAVSQDLVCVERVHNNTCNEMATEMFGPMHSETEHVSDELRCDQARNMLPTPEVVSPKLQVPVETKPQQDSRERVQHHDSREKISKTSDSREKISKTSGSRERPTQSHEMLPSSREQSDTTTQTMQLVTDAVVKSSLGLSGQASAVVKPSLELSGQASASQDELANSLYAFANIDAVCATSPDDIWKNVRTQLCAHKEELRSHEKCFTDSAARENNKCISPVSN